MVAIIVTLDITLAPIQQILVGIHIVILGEVGCRRMIGSSDRPGHGQLTRWIHLTGQDISYRVTALDTWLPSYENSIHTVSPTGCLHHRTRVDDDNHLLALGMESIRYTENHILLYLTEVELTIDLAIHSLTCLTADGDDGSVCLWLLASYTAFSNLDFIELRLSLIQEPHHRILVCLQLSLGILHIILIDFRKLRSSCHTDVLQTGNHIHRIAYINGSTTETTRHEVVRVDTEECHGLQALDRKSGIILQEHHTLGRTLTGDSCMSLQVWLTTIFISLESRSLHDIFEHTANIAVHILDIQLAILYCINNILHLSWITRHHQVVASLNFLFQRKVGTLTNPVGLHDSLISPVVAENIGQESLVALGINTVNLIIGRHDSPRIALANHHLETLQIQLTESTLAQSLIHLGTVSFLRVHGKVLGTYTHALTLHTLYKGGSDKTRYDWVF